MPAELKINGLKELVEALKKLPAELVTEAGPIVAAQADEMAHHVRAYYAAHRKTGNLEAHLNVTTEIDAVSATARVKNTAFHAKLFERGTGLRSYNGASRGSMPKADDFIPIAIVRRKIMLAALVDLVRRAGLTVETTA